ncbi:MAG: efflux RND transporter periplasmic adaptor subunit [Beijerinckiaceae bacterium]
MILHVERAVDRLVDTSIRTEFDLGEIEHDPHAGPALSPFRHALLLPLGGRSGECKTALVCARERVWRAEEAPLADEVAAAAGHAWNAFSVAPAARLRFSMRRSAIWGSAIAMLCIVAILPVPMTALAPAEVIAAAPSVIASPIDGVVGELPVSPNTYVEKDTVILRFVDTKLRNDAEIAERTRAMAQARLHRIVQIAFGSPKDARDLAIARAELAVANAEYRRAQEIYERATVRAPTGGLLVYSAKSDWIGKPVATGERIMDIVDPARTELRIDLSVPDAIALKPDARITFFPDGDPIDSREGRIARPAYRAMPTSDNKLAYRSFAVLHPNGDRKPYRIGIRGTAKLYGEDTFLAMYLLRRPFAAIRQQLGL